MVKLTNDFVIKSVHKLKLSKSADSKEEELLNRLTHLCLNDKSIDKIGDISHLKNICVLYLYNNNITKLDNLEASTSLTHVYLQNNAIEKIENLNHLKKLKKLYLARNCISVVEGLNENTALEELHIEDQVLPQDGSILFDPLTLFNIAGSLKVLNVSGNKLSSLRDLKVLKVIEKFDATNNLLTDVNDICDTIKYWNFLKELDLRLNKVTVKPKYRDKVILCTNRLELLDGKEIKDMTRSFLRRFEKFKEENRIIKEKQKSNQTPFSNEVTMLADHFPTSLGNVKETIPKFVLSLSSFGKMPAKKSDESVYSTKRFIPRHQCRVSNATGLHEKQ